MRLIDRASVPDEDRWRVYNKIAFNVAPLVLMGFTIASIDRMNVGFAKLQMSPDLGLTEAMFGFGAGIFFIGYCLFEIPSNMLLHKIGPRVWLSRILIVWGLVSAGTMFVQTPTQFYILRFLLGIAEAGFYPGALLFLTYWFPSHLRSQAVAIMLLGNTLSAIIGAPLSGAIMRFLDGWGGLAGWRWVFAIEGLPATLLGIFFLIVLRNGPRDASWLTDKEKALVTADLEAERTSQVAAGVRHRFIDAFRNSNIWGVVLANFCNLSTIYGIQFWLPTIVQRLNGTSVFNTGLIIAGLTLIPSAVLILNARHSDRKRERRWHATAGFALSALGLSMAGLWSNNAWLALTGLVLAHSGALIVSGTIFSLPATFVTGAAAAAGFALITTVGNLSGYTTPFLFGVLRDATGNFSAGFFGMSLLSAIGAAAILLIPALRRKAAGASAGPVQDQHAA